MITAGELEVLTVFEGLILISNSSHSLSHGVFHDLFWRIKKRTSDNMVVVCPDVMFKVQRRKVKDEEYVGFANKHLIKKIVDPDGKVRWYGCRRGVSYTKSNRCSWSGGIGVPPCDLANLADVVKATMRICEESHVFCEFGAGTLLGMLKIHSISAFPSFQFLTLFRSGGQCGYEFHTVTILRVLKDR